MDTDKLRSIIKTAATGMPGARLAPNGLSFDHRGTHYTVNERAMYARSRVREGTSTVPLGTDRAEGIIWCAARRVELSHDWAVKYGEGSSPLEAKRAAGIGREVRAGARGGIRG